MKIWHVGASDSPDDVNGVNYVIWAIAKAQSRLGHEVSLIVSDGTDKSAEETAKSFGLDLLKIPASKFRHYPGTINRLLAAEPPQLVHFHSVFIPNQATLAKRLRAAEIPFVITPHGGTSPHILRRDGLKKSLYSRFVEVPRFMRAAAISAVMPREADEIKAFAPDYKQPIRFVPNPIDDALFAETLPRQSSSRKKIVYLGRFDVQHKGIDILIEIARHLPQADFHLYGSEDAKTRRQLERLKKIRTCNVHFHQPVYGGDKIEVLRDADLYIQTSRWEVFGISIAEAMAVGLPCAVSKSLNIAGLFEKENLGVVLPSEPQEAARKISKVLVEPNVLAEFSARARDFAVNNFSARKVAEKYLDFYREAIRQPALQANEYERTATETVGKSVAQSNLTN